MMGEAVETASVLNPPRFARLSLRVLFLSVWFRLTGNSRPLMAYTQTIGVGLRARFAWMQVIYLHRPELIEIVCVKNDKSYYKPDGIEGLRRFIGYGLLTSEGEFHLRQRRMIQPAFHKKKINAYGECMVSFTSTRMGHWRDGEALDIHKEMMVITMDIIAKTMFNADVSSEAQKVSNALECVNDFQQRYNIKWIGKIFDALPLPSTRRIHAAIQAQGVLEGRLIRVNRN